ncbi:MAG: hypothetical protein JKY62_00485 [Desulfocapsa sp.]|uniref:Uncharacterized protein n=1 Tax=Desulfotalea psychrophila TaxID=84980 RepID=A0ABS3AW22_9BACT|nr:hypothetical protein [Desulfocapsa sp.]MBN4045963.1 hypothetical protein [bacterium AH-315-P11]MBN4068072.1 hypothetical protein [Desulfotalea psychrophila]
MKRHEKLLALLKRFLTRRDRIVPGDELQIKMVQAIKVYCINCKEHIFYVKDESKGAVPENLAPLKGHKPPQGFLCPFCNQISVAYSPAATLRTDRGYIS